MSATQMRETPLAGGAVAEQNTQVGIFNDDQPQHKRIATLQAAAALRGIQVYALASGGFLVGRWGYGKEVAGMSALVQFLRAQGVAA